MGKHTPKEAFDTYSQTMKSRTEKMIRGVKRVSEAPGIRAAKQQDKMRANLIRSIDDGTWADRVSAVSLSEWQDAMVNKGIPNISRGIDAAEPKMLSFFADLFDHQDKIQSELAAMPDTTPADAKARMNHNFDRMSQFKKRS